MDATMFSQKCVTSKSADTAFWKSATEFLWIDLPGVLITKDKKTGKMAIERTETFEEFTATLTDRVSDTTVEFHKAVIGLKISLDPEIPYVLKLNTVRKTLVDKIEQVAQNEYTLNFNPQIPSEMKA